MENISIEQAEQSLKEQSAEWVDKELCTGIELPVHYWKGGHYKQLFSMMTFRGFIIPYILAVILPIIIWAAIKWQEWDILILSIGIAVIYVLFDKLIHRRTWIKIMLTEESLTFVQGRKKTIIPWKSVKKITYVTEIAYTGMENYGRRKYRPTSGIAYEIKIQAGNKYYNYYDLYENSWNYDENGKAYLPSLPLHIAYVLIKTDRDKVRGA